MEMVPAKALCPAHFWYCSILFRQYLKSSEVKKARWSFRFLWDVYHYRHHSWRGWQDQGAMIDLLKENAEHRKHVKNIEVTLLNSYEKTYQRGQFAIHIAGCFCCHPARDCLNRLLSYKKYESSWGHALLHICIFTALSNVSSNLAKTSVEVISLSFVTMTTTASRSERFGTVASVSVESMLVLVVPNGGSGGEYHICGRNTSWLQLPITSSRSNCPKTLELLFPRRSRASLVGSKWRSTPSIVTK